MSGPTGFAPGRRYRSAVRLPETLGGSREGLTPPALLRLLQEAAGHDATARGAGMERLREEGLAWMLVRLVVEVARWPGAGEECVLSTWPRSFGGATAERDFTLEGAAEEVPGGRFLVEATSRWAVVDLAARRAVRLPAWVRALPVPPAPATLTLPPSPELPVEALLLGERARVVGEDDLDQVGHANNVRYLDWALETVPSDFLDGRELAGLDLSFRREARRGDRVRCRAYRLDEDRVAHEIAPDPPRKGGDALALVLTRWRRAG